MRRLGVLFVALVGTVLVSSAPASADEVEVVPPQTRQEELRGCVKWNYPSDPQVGDTWQHSYACVYQYTDEFWYYGDEDNELHATANVGTASCDRRVNATGTEYDYCTGHLNWAPTPLDTIRRDGDALVVSSDVHGCWIDARWALRMKDWNADDGAVRRGHYLQGDVIGATGTACGHVIEPTDPIEGGYRLIDDSVFVITP